MRPAAAGLLLLAFGALASAHRLDEYLQAATISLEPGRVEVQLRLTPGVDVFPFIIGLIDTNRDGVISAGEQRDYAERVLGDLYLTIDGEPLKLELVSAKFPAIDSMKEGLGEIQLDFAAAIHSNSPTLKLKFENHHQRPISAYLVNCLVPQDPKIQVIGQTRNYEQSVYQLDYKQQSNSIAWWCYAIAALLLIRLAILWHRRADRAGPASTQTETSIALVAGSGLRPRLRRCWCNKD